MPSHVILSGSANRIKSLKNPDNKMSKSDTNTNSRIELSDTPEIIQTKFRKALSDSSSVITYDPIERPAIANLIEIYCAVTELDTESACKEFRHIDTVRFKSLVADAVIEKLNPIRMEYERISQNVHYLQQVLQEGNSKAAVLAEQTLSEVMNRVGLR